MLRIFLIFTFVIVAVSGGNLSSSTEKVIGKTFDINTSSLIYTEKRYRTYSKSGLYESNVWYITGNLDTLAYKNLKYKHSGYRPDIEFSQYKLDYFLKLENRDDSVFIQFKEGKKKFRKSLKVPANAVVDGGIRNFVIYNLNELLQKKILTFPLIVPERAAFYYFEIKLEKIINKDTILFSMNPKNMFLSLLAPKIEFYYNIPNMELETYSGISDIKDASGKNFHVRINYNKDSDANYN